VPTNVNSYALIITCLLHRQQHASEKMTTSKENVKHFYMESLPGFAAKAISEAFFLASYAAYLAFV